MLKKRFIFIGIVLTLIANIAWCKTFTPSQIKKANTLLETVNFEKMVQQQIDAIVNGLASQDPKFAKHKQEFKELITEIFQVETSKKDIAEAYLNVFTEEELDEMIKFNKSPLGQKILKKMPELTKNSVANMQKKMANNEQKINDLIIKIASQQE